MRNDNQMAVSGVNPLSLASNCGQLIKSIIPSAGFRLSWYVLLNGFFFHILFRRLNSILQFKEIEYEFISLKWIHRIGYRICSVLSM